VTYIQFSRCPLRVKEVGVSIVVLSLMRADHWTVFVESLVLATRLGFTVFSCSQASHFMCLRVCLWYYFCNQKLDIHELW
jgi:hypothetical protein